LWQRVQLRKNMEACGTQIKRSKKQKALYQKEKEKE
jgi:hypothetical protein